MVIDDLEELQGYVQQALEYQLRLQKIEMPENMGIFVVLADSITNQTLSTYLGLQEEFHRKIALETLKDEDSGIELFGG